MKWNERLVCLTEEISLWNHHAIMKDDMWRQSFAVLCHGCCMIQINHVTANTHTHINKDCHCQDIQTNSWNQLIFFNFLLKWRSSYEMNENETFSTVGMDHFRYFVNKLNEKTPRYKNEWMQTRITHTHTHTKKIGNNPSAQKMVFLNESWPKIQLNFDREIRPFHTIVRIERKYLVTKLTHKSLPQSWMSTQKSCPWSLFDSMNKSGKA